MNEEQDRRRIATANAMREWAMGDEGLFAVFDAVRADYLATIALTEPTEREFREAIYHRVKALADIRRTMEAVIADGAGKQKFIEALMRRQQKGMSDNDG